VRLRGPAGEVDLAVQGAFLYLQGQRPVTDWLRGALPVAEGGCIGVGGDYATALPGVFAVGDVLCGAEVKQAVIAAAQGAAAAVQAERFLRGRDRPRADWR
jgi:thioredoxin reductase (NADPH)